MLFRSTGSITDIIGGNEIGVTHVGGVYTVSYTGSVASISLDGDVTGSSDNNTVIKWQNLPVENISSSLINGDVYTWNAFANTWTNYQNGGDYSVIVQLPLSGTNGSTTTTDLAPVSYAVNPYGGAAISTTKEKWSLSGSLYFDGSGDYLAGGTNDLLAFGANDWTAEFWINPDSGYGSGGFSPYACGLIDFRYDGYGAGWLILLDTSGQDRKSTRLNSSHVKRSRMPSSA